MILNSNNPAIKDNNILDSNNNNRRNNQIENGTMRHKENSFANKYRINNSSTRHLLTKGK